MKQSLTVMVVMLLTAGNAMALVTSDVIDWNGGYYGLPPVNGSDTYMGQGFTVLFDAWWLGDFSYTHSFDFDQTGMNLQAATLSLTHVGNVWDCWNPELWFATSNGGHFIGMLSTSHWGGWTTDTWNLNQAILNEMSSTNPWSLCISLSDPTFIPDVLLLDRSVLTVEYSGAVTAHATPEPTTSILLGVGLLGLGLGAKVKKYRKK